MSPWPFRPGSISPCRPRCWRSPGWRPWYLPCGPVGSRPSRQSPQARLRRAGTGTAAAGARRLADKLPLPRPVTAGLAGPFARRARSAATLATITIGLTAAVLAVGLGSQITKIVKSIGVAEIDRTLFGRLAWLVVVLAGVGIFATLLAQARERVHELGIHKALGMTPRQVITMVTCWAVAPAAIAAAVALPACTVLEPVVARAVVSAQAGPAENMIPFMPHVPGGPGAAPAPSGLQTQGVPGRAAPSGQAAPSSGALRNASPSPRQSRIVQQSGSGQQPEQSVRALFAGTFRTAGQNPYSPAELALLALAGLAIALAGALGPAAWAAASRTTTALRAE
ncbi:MAG TPA: FtsX-like permease family protein [Streptosporangiaceae bacterium]|nr:FtsX-like permease family protein [Streptosporangiaceae bacterium]